MIRLDTTTRKLQILLAGAVATSQLPVVVCYSDQTAVSYQGGTQVVSTNSTATVDICAAPAASTTRDIDTINVQNADTAAATVTIQYNDNATLYPLFKVLLAVGDQLTYVHGEGWSVVDANGAVKTVASPIAAAVVVNVPAGGVSATNVQTALNELDTEKAPLASPSFTGTVSASGDITLTGAGKRILGDWDDGLTGNYFQNRIADTSTYVSIVPNGATTHTAGIIIHNDSAGANGAYGTLDINSVELVIHSGKYGSGSYLPLVVSVGGADRLKFNTDGSINFPALGTRITGDFSNATFANRTAFQTSTVNSNTGVTAIPNGTATGVSFQGFNNSDPTNASVAQFGCSVVETQVIATKVGTGSYLPMVFYTNGAERMRIDTSGNVMVTGSGLLGYGTGAGGTVTQATNKNTAVTLNKATGKITMHNAALPASSSVHFIVNNSLVAAADVVVVSIQNPVSSSLSYQATVSAVDAGLFDVVLRNVSAGSLSEAVVINFVVIKGATS